MESTDWFKPGFVLGLLASFRALGNLLVFCDFLDAWVLRLSCALLMVASCGVLRSPSSMRRTSRSIKSMWRHGVIGASDEIPRNPELGLRILRREILFSHLPASKLSSPSSSPWLRYMAEHSRYSPTSFVSFKQV